MNMRSSSKKIPSSTANRGRMPASRFGGGSEYGRSVNGLVQTAPIDFSRKSSGKNAWKTTSGNGRRPRSTGSGRYGSGENGVVTGSESASRPPATLYEALLRLKAQEEEKYSAATATRDVCVTIAECGAASVNRRQHQLYSTDVGVKPLQQQQLQQQQFDRLSASLTTSTVREINMPREGICEVLDKTTDRVAESRVLSVILGLLSTLPVAMAMIGVKHLENCPVQPKIPIYLLVGGCFGLLKMLSLLWRQVRLRRYRKMGDIDSSIEVDDDDNNNGIIMSKSYRYSQMLLTTFLLVWFIVGNFWVLSVWRPHFRQLLNQPNNWCDKTAYMFAFAQIIVCHVIIAVIVLVSTTIAACRCVIADSDSS